MIGGNFALSLLGKELNICDQDRGLKDYSRIIVLFKIFVVLSCG